MARVLLGLSQNRNTRNGRYLCSFWTYYVFRVNRIVFSFILTPIKEWTEYSSLRLNKRNWVPSTSFGKVFGLMWIGWIMFLWELIFCNFCFPWAGLRIARIVPKQCALYNKWLHLTRYKLYLTTWGISKTHKNPCCQHQLPQIPICKTDGGLGLFLPLT